jgi:hypothetical protein
MLVQAAGFIGSARKVVIRVIICVYCTPLKKIDRFVQNSGIAGAEYVSAGYKREP